MSPASAVALVQTIVRQCIAHGPNARWKDVEAARAAGTAGRFGTDGTAAQVSPIVSGHPGAPEPPVGQPQPTVASAPPIGPVRTSSGTSSGTSFVAGIPLGRTSPAQLRDVARICRAHELGEVSVTPWRSIMFVNVEVNTVLLAARIAAAGLVTSAADPSHGVVACIGRAGCWQTELDTLAEAADAIADRSAGAHQLGSLHVSGCAKSCATTEPVDVLLLGRDDSSGFDIVRAAAERS